MAETTSKKWVVELVGYGFVGPYNSEAEADLASDEFMEDRKRKDLEPVFAYARPLAPPSNLLRDLEDLTRYEWP